MGVSSGTPRGDAALVESASNPAVKELRRALRQGVLFAGKFWVAESPKLLEEALRGGLNVPVAYVDKSRERELRTLFDGRFFGEWVPLGEKALASLATVETPQGLLALVEKPVLSERQFFSAQRLTVVLDRIQDPGNAGTILRAAEAFGATGSVFLAGSVSADSPKVLRASAGSRFRVPVLEGLAAGQFASLSQQQGMRLFAGSLAASAPLSQVKWAFPLALIVGNEGAGVQHELASAATLFRIPTQGVESLNAGVSAAIALYEIAANGQRTAAGGSGRVSAP